MYITEDDYTLIRQLIFNPDLKPNFEFLKSYLVWDDEIPKRISNKGREFLYDLLIVRGFIHREVPDNKWGLDPDYFKSMWKFGLDNIPQWPGFMRLTLSEIDKKYLEECLNYIS